MCIWCTLSPKPVLSGFYIISPQGFTQVIVAPHPSFCASHSCRPFLRWETWQWKWRVSCQNGFLRATNTGQEKTGESLWWGPESEASVWTHHYIYMNRAAPASLGPYPADSSTSADLFLLSSEAELFFTWIPEGCTAVRKFPPPESQARPKAHPVSLPSGIAPVLQCLPQLVLPTFQCLKTLALACLVL